jgi:hypothetical protein
LIIYRIMDDLSYVNRLVASFLDDIEVEDCTDALDSNDSWNFAPDENSGAAAVADDLEVAECMAALGSDDSWNRSPDSIDEIPGPELADDPEVPIDAEVMDQDGGAAVDWIGLIDFSKLFTLRKVRTWNLKNFNYVKSQYEIDIVNLPRNFSNEASMRVMPKIFEAIFEQITASFGPEDFVKIDLTGGDLTNPHSLSVRKFKDFSLEDLMQKLEMMNSQQKFRIDEKFTIGISRTVPPSGGGRNKRKHDLNIDSRKRYASTLVTVQVDRNLCLPAAMFLGVYRLTHDVKRSDGETAEGEYFRDWRQLTDKCHSRLTKEATKVALECGFKIGRKFNILADLEKFQETCFPGFRFKILSQQHGTVVIRRFPERLAPGMKDVYLHLDKGHFDLVTSVTGFLGQSYFCDSCDRPYVAKSRHRCAGKCSLCYRSVEDCPEIQRLKCEDCRRTFRNQVSLY